MEEYESVRSSGGGEGGEGEDVLATPHKRAAYRLPPLSSLSTFSLTLSADLM